MDLYCENGNCRVVLFVDGKDHDQTNCPGCGQFGRTKGK